MSNATQEQSPDPGLLTDIYPDLHNSGEVDWAVQQSPERMPNDPEARVAAYLGSLAGRHGMLGGSEERRRAQIEHHVMNPEDIPEGYFEHQRRIAREQGHGDIEITREMRDQLAEALVADQTASLQSWVEYVNHPDADYPEWFRYYTLRNVLKLADYDKEKGRFRKRSRGTTAPYPELNREALAYVYDALEDRRQGTQQEDPEMEQLVQSANFNKLYSRALRESMPANPEQLTDTAGEWTKYDRLEQNEDSDRARQLAESLQGHGTGWCTAGESTAEMQLKDGDFYVYYSYDENKEATIPRAAIRMEYGQVAEVRGINEGQELEPAMLDIVQERLQDLPGGAEYQQRAEDMKRLTAIERKVTDDPGVELSRDELRFLYELDRIIEGFGYEEDPRIGELREQRDFIADMETVFAAEDHNQIAQQLIEAGMILTVYINLHKFHGLDHNQIARQLIETGEIPNVVENLDRFQGLDGRTAQRLIEAGKGDLVARNPHKFQDLDDQIAQQLIEAGYGPSIAFNLDEFQGIDHAQTAQQLIETGNGFEVARNMDKFEDLDHDQIAQQLIETGHGLGVAANLDKFEDLDHNQLTQQLIEAGYGPSIALNLDKFHGFDHDQIAQQLIEIGHGSTVAANLDRFQGLDDQIAQQLIEAGQASSVAANLDKFQGVDHAQTAQQLIEAGQAKAVAHNLDKFKDLDHNQIAQQLIEAGMILTVYINLHKFHGLDHNQIAQQLIEIGHGSTVAANLDRFQGLDDQTATD